MKRLLLMIDLHIVVLGIVVSVLLVGLVSVITFVPGSPRLIPSVFVGIIPLLIFLEPAIITRTIDRVRIRGDALAYFGVNTLIATLYGIVCGLLIFGLLPRSKASLNEERRVSRDTVTPISRPVYMLSYNSNINPVIDTRPR
jgi:Na+/H+-dicarboxylate symporter